MDKIKSLAIKYKNILQNFSYLTILQVFNLFFPVIIYPFFIDLFGLDLWGKIVLAQSLAFFLAIFVDFGYDRYATKEISIHRNNFKKLSEISSCVILIRVVLGIIVFNLFAIVVYNAPFFKGDEVLYLVSFFVNFNFILFPKWFFLGMERMKYIVLINVSVKVLFVILMYVFIKDKSDYLLVPLFFGLGAFVGGLIGIKMLFSFKGISFKIYPFKMYYHYIKSSYLLFASALVISIKDRFNIFIVGYFLGMQEVAIYDIGMKLVSLIMQPIESVNGAIFPKVAKELNMDFVKKVAGYSLIYVISVIFMAQLFLAYIFDFLNVKEIIFEKSIRLLLFIPVFLTMSLFLARNCFIVHDKFKLLFSSMIWTSLFYLVLVTCLFLTKNTQFDYLVLSVFLVYIFEFLYRYMLSKKYRLLE